MFTKVENKNRKNAALKYYYHIRDLEGKDYLFSESQMKSAANRADQNPEDVSSVEQIEEHESPFWVGAIFGFFGGAMSMVFGYALGQYIIHQGIWIK